MPNEFDYPNSRASRCKQAQHKTKWCEISDPGNGYVFYVCPVVYSPW